MIRSCLANKVQLYLIKLTYRAWKKKKLRFDRVECSKEIDYRISTVLDLVDREHRYFEIFFNEISKLTKGKSRFIRILKKNLTDAEIKFALGVLFIEAILNFKTKFNESENLLHNELAYQNRITLFQELNKLSEAWGEIFEDCDLPSAIQKFFSKILLVLVEKKILDQKIQTVRIGKRVQTIVLIKLNLDQNLESIKYYKKDHALRSFLPISQNYSAAASILSVYKNFKTNKAVVAEIDVDTLLIETINKIPIAIKIYNKVELEKRLLKYLNNEFGLKEAKIPELFVKLELIIKFLEQDYQYHKELLKPDLRELYSEICILDDANLQKNIERQEKSRRSGTVKTKIDISATGTVEEITSAIPSAPCAKETNRVLKKTVFRMGWGGRRLLSDDCIVPLENSIDFLLNQRAFGIEYRKKQERLAQKESRLVDYKKRLQSKLFILHFWEFLFHTDVFYTAYFRDFRGRIYPYSSIHPMSNKVARLFAIPGSIARAQKTKNSHIYVKRVLYEIGPISTIIAERFNLNRGSNQYDWFCIVNILYELGKLFKNDLLLKNKAGLNDFVSLGLKMIDASEEDKSGLSLENALAFNKFQNELKHFEQFRRWRKFSFLRDSTGSAFQHWAVLLGLKSKDALRKLNLSGACWHDIYQVVIEDFKQTLRGSDVSTIINSKLGFKILKRQFWKRTIMTSNYNVTLWSSKNYLISALEDEYPGLFKKNKNEIEVLHKAFFDYLKNDFFIKFYRESRTDFLADLLGSDKKTFIYKKSTKGVLIEKYNKRRVKFTLKKYTRERDMVRTQRSLPANLIQYEDAKLAEFLLENIEVLAIHDAFIVEPKNLGKLIDHANWYFQKKLTEKDPVEDYAPFILF